MNIYLASDHAGFELQQQLRDWLISKDKIVIEIGAHNYDASDNYTDFMHSCAQRFLSEYDTQNRILVLGGSGQGEAMCMNRYKGIRSLVWYGGKTDIVSLARKHNDANCMSIGARFVDFETTKIAVDLFLSTDFEAGRHSARVQALDITNT